MPNLNSEIKVLKTLEEKEVKKLSEAASVEIWKPNTGNRFVLLGFSIATNTAANIVLEDETTVFWSHLTSAATTLHFLLPNMGYSAKAINNKLKINQKSEVAIKVTGTFYGYEE